MAGTLVDSLIRKHPVQGILVPDRREPIIKPRDRMRSPMTAASFIKGGVYNSLEAKPMPGKAANTKISGNLSHRPFKKGHQRDHPCR
jgi:hypothetical protein